MSELEARGIEKRIFAIRGVKVMLDRDLAELYGVPTKALNQAVKRNPGRFPAGFMFRLTSDEMSALVNADIRFRGLKHSTVTPRAFTEFGIAMLSSVLKSRHAIGVNVKIMQTFIQLRQWASQWHDLADLISALERQVSGHDVQIRDILQRMRDMTADGPSNMKQIGFRIPAPDTEGERG